MPNNSLLTQNKNNDMTTKMLKPTLAYALAGMMMLAACGKSEPTTIEGKREKLEQLKKERSRIAADIATLESEVGKAGKEEASASAQPKTVVLAQVQAAPFRHFIEVQGQVESDNVVQANAEMPGLIKQVLVKEGDRVAKGQVLAIMDSKILESGIQELRTQLELANTLYEKQKGLWDQKIGSEVQFLNAKTQKEGLERRISTLRQTSGQSRILAPIAGTVDMVTARQGGAASPGVPLFRIVNLSDLKVVAKVSESYLAVLKPGHKAEVTLAGEDAPQALQGTISYVSSVVDQLSRTVDVEIRVPKGTSVLRPNMTTKVRINDRSFENAIVIDQNLVQTSEEGQMVFVAVTEGGKRVAQARKITPGLSYNGRIQVEKGLKAGDEIITQGYQELTDGQIITEQREASAQTTKPGQI